MFPVSGPTLRIEPLSIDKQTEIARAVSGTRGEELMERSCSTPGIRELVSVPLYLNVLLATSSEEAFTAETKDEILCLFVKRHENLPGECTGPAQRPVRYAYGHLSSTCLLSA